MHATWIEGASKKHRVQIGVQRDGSNRTHLAK
jgi:hypothetical protein